MQLMIIAGIFRNPDDNAPFLLLTGEDGKNPVPVALTGHDAWLVATAISKRRGLADMTEQPDFADIYFLSLRELDAELVSASVGIEPGKVLCLSASIKLRTPKGEAVIAARPAYALALALLEDKPISVAGALLQLAGEAREHYQPDKALARGVSFSGEESFTSMTPGELMRAFRRRHPSRKTAVPGPELEGEYGELYRKLVGMTDRRE